ncbi:MAG TPA: zf-HC2 domain-containing protein [Terriglobia bacterium]|nr:zf-HC2 domain-containing protein [Terriglobia bacterium]
MNELDHLRAERLMFEARVEAGALSATDRHWLEAHLEGCERCAALAQSMTSAIEQLRAVSVAVDPELVARTRLLVKFRARELERGHSWLLPVWILCALSWVIGILTAPLVWRGFEWMGHRAGLPTLVWASGFVLWWAVPALVVVLLLGAGRRQAVSRM